MILLDTILKRIPSLKYYEFDVRNLNRWIEHYPNCFPKFIIKGNYSVIFNSKLLRYELHKTI